MRGGFLRVCVFLGILVLSSVVWRASDDGAVVSGPGKSGEEVSCVCISEAACGIVVRLRWESSNHNVADCIYKKLWCTIEWAILSIKRWQDVWLSMKLKLLHSTGSKLITKCVVSAANGLYSFVTIAGAVLGGIGIPTFVISGVVAPLVSIGVSSEVDV